MSSCSSLHFLLAEVPGFLGVFARELGSEVGVDIAKPACFPTFAVRAAEGLGHGQLRAKDSKCGGHTYRKVLPLVAAFSLLGAILAKSPVKTNVEPLCFATSCQKWSGQHKLQGLMVRDLSWKRYRLSADVEVKQGLCLLHRSMTSR